MKNKITLLLKIALILFLATSCNSEISKPEIDPENILVLTNDTLYSKVVDKDVSIEKTKDEIGEEVLQPEGTAVEGEEDRLKYFTVEKCMSNCYIIDYFLEMDVAYITVDFVSYKIIKVAEGEGDSGGNTMEKIVNKSKKQRTFIVNQVYLECGRSDSKTIEELVEMFKKDPRTIFSLEADEGIVNEFYFDDCSG